jgi:O-acetyl-ADP-ribose deacetylase (regulator of RNase III)
MINTLHGNVLDTVDSVIVHCVNCRGVMGSGIAREIKERFPEAYETYRQTYENGVLHLGSVSYVYFPSDHNVQQKIIANAAGQDWYGAGKVHVDYDATRTCFLNINEDMKFFRDEYGITTMNFPLFGCGLAGGDWNIVSQIIEEEVSDEWTKNLYLYP